MFHTSSITLKCITASLIVLLLTILPYIFHMLLFSLCRIHHAWSFSGAVEIRFTEKRSYIDLLHHRVSRQTPTSKLMPLVPPMVLCETAYNIAIYIIVQGRLNWAIQRPSDFYTSIIAYADRKVSSKMQGLHDKNVTSLGVRSMPFANQVTSLRSTVATWN